MAIIFVTSSKNKFDEVASIIDGLLKQPLELPELQELDAHNIISAKITAAREKISGDIIVEDTGLYIRGLNGFPGPLVKWMLSSIGTQGIFEIIGKLPSQKAEAKTIIGCARGESVYYFEGKIIGTIVAPRGDNGFGWDEIFQPEGSNKTFAEMSAAEKLSMSMRGIAARKLSDFLDKLNK